jgi:fatty-acyl-CoA synthase
LQLSELSYGHGGCDEPLRGLTIGAAWEHAARRYPDNEALVSVHQGLRHTYAQLDAEADACARGLLGLGVDPVDRVALWAPNCAECAIVQYATAKIGAILVSVNPAYRAGELEYVLRQSGSRVLISAQRHKSSDYRELVGQARAQCLDLEHVVFLNSPGWAQLLQSGRGRPTDELRRCSASLSFDDPINIQYTSGTTGSPKGATLTHHGLLNNGFFVGARCRYTDSDRICVPVPYYHCFGMVLGNLAALTHGACVVLPGASFEPAATLREQCAFLYAQPLLSTTTQRTGRRTLGEKEDTTMDNQLATGLDMVGCPACAAPAEVIERYVLESTDGPIEHATVLCTDRHRFTVLVERLRTPRPTREEAQRWARPSN